MPKPVIQAEVKAVLPTSGGCAVFLGNAEKVFVIYIDHNVGAAITMAMRKVTRERPQTHDLIITMLKALGAKVDRVVINDFNDGVYFARLILSAENELYERKIVELDARPSDSIAIATLVEAPIYVSEKVWNAAEDMSEMLRKMDERELAGEDPSDSHEDGPDDDLPKFG